MKNNKYKTITVDAFQCNFHKSSTLKEYSTKNITPNFLFQEITLGATAHCINLMKTSRFKNFFFDFHKDYKLLLNIGFQRQNKD